MSGSCWDDGPDHCPGCPYCQGARATPTGERVEYPDEQAARDIDQAQRRLNAEAAHRLEMRRIAAQRTAEGLALTTDTRRRHG